MKLNHDQAFGFNPSFYMQYRPQLAYFPFIFNVTGDCAVGNSSGYDEKAIWGGLGEYIERYHFYNEVDSEDDNTLTCRDTLKSKFFHLINQVKVTESLPENHSFSLTTVRNIFTKQFAFVPKVMISLADADSIDRQFIPFIDSCGQAVHMESKTAFTSAIKEFIERQALVGAWLSGTAKYQISLAAHTELHEVNAVITKLQNHGELLAFDVSNHLPGYSIVIFYFSKDNRDNVRYSVGAACDFSPAQALSRAVHELWQSYTFLYLNADNPENLDNRYQYLNDLINFNSINTKNIIPFLAKKCLQVSHDYFLNLKTFNQEEIVQNLKNISPDIFYYERSSFHFGRKFYFYKIISPDFFLHMGIQKPINLDNSYANLLGIKKDMPILHAIPFP